jgi:D-alanyl-D-alanine carboxypeptidase
MLYPIPVALLCAALLMGGAPATGQVTTPKQALIFSKLSDAEIAKRVQLVLDRLKTRPEMVGLSIGIGRSDHVIVDRGIGLADIEWNQLADADSAFRIGSLTKQFTAAAVMKLVERGQLALDDALSKYLPEFDSGGRILTIRQLLNHTSGIPNYTAQPGFMGKGDRLDFSEKDLLQYVAGKPFNFEPGTSWAYSNTNYLLLGLIVEKLSGRSYAEFMRDEFFQPLKMTHTRVDSESAIIPNRAKGYGRKLDTNERRNAMLMTTANSGGAGVLVSTAGDLIRWQIALITGRAVSPASFQQMIHETAKTGIPDTSYGFGLMIDQPEGQQRISHTGGINGFNSTLSWFPGMGLIIAVISNSEPMPSTVVEDQVIAALTSDKLPPPPRSTPQPGAEAALRKLIADEIAGTPDYSTMSPQMAEATRTQLAGIQEVLRPLGSIRSVTFQNVTLDGLDSYRVDFENGASIFTLTLYPDGKIATLFFRPAPQGK